MNKNKKQNVASTTVQVPKGMIANAHTIFYDETDIEISLSINRALVKIVQHITMAAIEAAELDAKSNSKAAYRRGFEDGKITEIERSAGASIKIVKEKIKQIKGEAIKGFVSRLYGDIALAHKSWQFNEIDKLLDVIQERLVKELKENRQLSNELAGLRKP